jgi:ABC-2 type transport system permease protein
MSEVALDNLHSQNSGQYKAYLPFFTLLKREVLRFLAVASQTIAAPVVSASLYLLVFGVSLGERISVLEGFSYAQFVIPGLILMGVVNNSFANSSSSLFMCRYLGYIVDFLVIPITPPQFIIAFTVAAMIRGFVVGLVVFIVSTFFADIPWVNPGAAILILAIASLLFSQLGIIAALYSSSFDALSMYTNFLILPLIYLGGLFYPVSMLPEFWGKISMLNPMFYMIDGFRHAALGVGDISLVISISISGAFAIGLFIWAAYLIGKGHKLRT